MEKKKLNFVPPDVSLRYIIENPRWLDNNADPGEKAKRYATLLADRDLALANHVNAGLALSTFMHAYTLTMTEAVNDAEWLAMYRVWLQLLKSLHGKPLQYALQRISGETAIATPPVKEEGIIDKLKNALRGEK